MPIVLDGTNGITTPDVESAGPISGTTGTFSGAVQASGVTTNIYPLVSATAVASTSGTSIDFTGIPSWVRRVTVMFSGVSTNGSSIPQIQLGDAGGVETTGYVATAQWYYLGNGIQTSTSGQPLNTTGGAGAAVLLSGSISIALISANTWVFSGNVVNEGSVVTSCAGRKTLSDTLDRVRITTVNGTDTFDAGTINIMYE